MEPHHQYVSIKFILSTVLFKRKNKCDLQYIHLVDTSFDRSILWVYFVLESKFLSPIWVMTSMLANDISKGRANEDQTVIYCINKVSN